MKEKKQDKPKFVFPGHPYVYLRCGAANQALPYTPHNIKRYKQDKLANILTYMRGNLRITADGTNKPIPESSWRTLDLLMLKFTEQNKDGKANSVDIEFDDVAEYRNAVGKQARARLSKQWLEDLQNLFRIYIGWNDPQNKDFLRSRIIYNYAFLGSKKIMRVTFTPDFAQYITNGYLMPFNTKLGALDNRNPNIYKIGRKLIYHYMMLSNRKLGTHDRLSLQKILEVCPDIPTPEEVYEKYNRDYRNKIIFLVENCLDGLVNAGILTEWTWWKKANQPLSDDELLQMGWKLIKKCMIHFTLVLPQPVQY